MISTNQFKNGNHIEVEGTVFKILEFQHVKPGKGGAFVRTKLRRTTDGNVIDRRSGPARSSAHPHRGAQDAVPLRDGTDAHFMDSESYEQLALPEPSVAEALKWVKPNETVDLLFIDGEPSDVQLPASVELEVTHTEPGVRGDTASGGGNKPATLETGATVNVPLFVNIGDRVKVDTRSGAYMSRLRVEDDRPAEGGRVRPLQHDLTGRPLDDLFERTRRRSRGRSLTRRPTTRRSSTS